MKIDRLLEIVILLLNRDKVSTRELAERFGVSPRTIQRDMISIALAGIPLYAREGRGGGYSLLPEYLQSSQTLRPEESAWVARALLSLSTSYSGYPLEKLAERFNALAGRCGAPQIYWDLSVTRENLEVQRINAVIEDAITARRQLFFHYRNAEGQQSFRTLEPLVLHYKWYAWYLFGWEEEKQRYTTCKVARMSAVEQLPGRCTRDHGDVQARLRESERAYLDTCTEIDVRFAPESENLMKEYFPDCPVEPLSCKECRMLLHVPERERLWKALLLSFGDAVRIVSPESYQLELKSSAEKFLRNHDNMLSRT